MNIPDAIVQGIVEDTIVLHFQSVIQSLFENGVEIKEPEATARAIVTFASLSCSGVMRPFITSVWWDSMIKGLSAKEPYLEINITTFLGKAHHFVFRGEKHES